MSYRPLTKDQEKEMEAEQQAFADELELDIMFPDEEEEEPGDDEWSDEQLEERAKMNAGRPTKEELKESMGPVQILETNAHISASNCMRWGAFLG